MLCLIDPLTFGDEAEENAVRSGERQEHLTGGGPAAGSVHDADLGVLQEVARLHELVDALDAELDGQHTIER